MKTDFKKILLITASIFFSINMAVAQQCDSSGSLIPNHDFNDYSQLPDTPGQMDRAIDWFQVTAGTSDYYYDPNFLPLVGTSTPSPDGLGFVGFFTELPPTFLEYHEYIGNVLNTPLVAGESYTFKIEIGSLLSTYSAATTFTEDVVLYAIETDSGNRPLGTTFDIITTQGIAAEELARVPMNFATPGEWRDITFTFTPTKNYQILVIGSENVIETDDSGLSSSYTLVDNLRVDRSSCFDVDPTTDTKVQKIPSNNWLGLILLTGLLITIISYRKYKKYSVNLH